MTHRLYLYIIAWKSFQMEVLLLADERRFFWHISLSEMSQLEHLPSSIVKLKHSFIDFLLFASDYNFSATNLEFEANI